MPTTRRDCRRIKNKETEVRKIAGHTRANHIYFTWYFFRPRGILPILLFFFITGAACTPTATKMPPGYPRVGGEPFELHSGYYKSLGESDLEKRYIILPPANFFTTRGAIGNSVSAESGESLKSKWEGFFPGYRLYYFAPGEKEGVVVGECHFSGGCNKISYLFDDRNKNGIPDAFYLIEVESLDYGYDEETPGYLDRYRHTYAVKEDEYCIIHDLLFYRCPPPVSLPPDTCETFCSPPYLTTEIAGKPAPLIYRTEAITCGALFNGGRKDNPMHCQ